VFAYRSTLRALNASTLNVVRYKGFKFARAAQFPEAVSFKTGADRGPRARPPARALPPGRLRELRHDLGDGLPHAPIRLVKGRFVDVTARHPDLFASEIARKQAALERLKGTFKRTRASTWA